MDLIDLTYLEKTIPLEKFVLNSMDAHPSRLAHAEIARGLWEKSEVIFKNIAAEQE